MSEYENNNISWIQQSIMSGYDIMGNSLETDLFANHALCNKLYFEIHDAVHTKAYREIVLDYLLDPDLSPREVVNDALINAFKKTSQYTTDDSEILDQLSTDELSDVDARRDLKDWLMDNDEQKLNMLIGGLKNCVLKNTVIPKMGSDLGRLKSVQGAQEWRKQNPEAAAEIQQKAIERAAEVAEPTVFTDELRLVIQNLFNQGFTYEEVVGKLEAEYSVVTTRGSLQYAVERYGDLFYTNTENSRKELAEFQELLKSIFEKTKQNRRETIRILTEMGYSEVKIQDWMGRDRLNLRKKVDWQRKTYTQDNYTLETLLLNKLYISENLSFVDFVNYLEGLGIEVNLTASSFQRKVYELRNK